MKFRQYALFACLTAALGVAACSESPTAEGNGEPEAIVSTRSTTVQAEDVSFSITAYTVDKNLKRIAGPLTAASAGAAVRVDSAVYLSELAETQVFITTTAATEGTTVTLSGHGLTKDVTVIVE